VIDTALKKAEKYRGLPKGEMGEKIPPNFFIVNHPVDAYF